MPEITTTYDFGPFLAIDTGGHYINLYEAGYNEPFDVINMVDYEAGQYRTLSKEELTELFWEAWDMYSAR